VRSARESTGREYRHAVRPDFSAVSGHAPHVAAEVPAGYAHAPGPAWAPLARFVIERSYSAPVETPTSSRYGGIVFTYDMWVNERHLSTSLTTIELESEGEVGTSTASKALKSAGDDIAQP
jgi:hypothetical protein